MSFLGASVTYLQPSATDGGGGAWEMAAGIKVKPTEGKENPYNYVNRGEDDLENGGRGGGVLFTVSTIRKSFGFLPCLLVSFVLFC